MSSTEVNYEIINEPRTPPRRSRNGRYSDVYEAMDSARSKAGAWIALASGDKDAMGKVRNAVSRRVMQDQAWHTSIHADEEGSDAHTLFVKYDKENKRLPRRARTVNAPELAEAARESNDDAWFDDSAAASE